MPLLLVINPTSPTDTIGAITTNSLVVDVVLRGLPSGTAVWVAFNNPSTIEGSSNIYVPESNIVSGETTITLSLKPIDGIISIQATVKDSNGTTVIGIVDDDIEVDLPPFSLAINGGAPTTTSTFITLTISGIPPGEILWVLLDSTQIIGLNNICFYPADTATGSVTFSTQLRGPQNGIRTVDIRLFQNSPYYFWGTASDTITLALVDPPQPNLFIFPTPTFPQGEAYTNSIDGYIHLNNLAPGDSVDVLLSGDLTTPLSLINFDSSQTLTGGVDITTSLLQGASEGDGYSDGPRTITATVTNLEQQIVTALDEILLDTTPPIISFIPEAYGSTIAGVPGSIIIETNEPADVEYTFDSIMGDTDSYTESTEVFIPQGDTSVTIRAVATDFAGNVSEEFTSTFELSLLGARPPFKFFPEGSEAYTAGLGIYSRTDMLGQSEAIDAYRVGRPQDDFLQTLPRTIDAPFDKTPTFLDDPMLLNLDVNLSINKTLNRYAKVMTIDSRGPMTRPIIMRPYGSLRDPNRGGFVDANVRELDPYISGGHVRSMNDFAKGLRYSAYWDSNSNQWIFNTTTLNPEAKPVSIFDGYTGRSRYTFMWVPFKGSRLI